MFASSSLCFASFTSSSIQHLIELEPVEVVIVVKVILAFNSALLCAFSSTVVGGIAFSLPSTSFVTI
ncbi:hypothetical protein Tco_0361806, partial [Tanacetum coccineum]